MTIYITVTFLCSLYVPVADAGPAGKLQIFKYTVLWLLNPNKNPNSLLRRVIVSGTCFQWLAGHPRSLQPSGSTGKE